MHKNYTFPHALRDGILHSSLHKNEIAAKDGRGVIVKGRLVYFNMAFSEIKAGNPQAIQHSHKTKCQTQY